MSQYANQTTEVVKAIKPITPEQRKQNEIQNKAQNEAQNKDFKKKKLEGSLMLLAKASIVPIGFYAFSKYQKYDSKKTLKVTIIGSVVVLGAIVFNGFSGAWSGTTFMDRTFGQQKYW
jgi:hypothetical protein